MVTKAKHNPKYQSIISNVIRRSLDAYTRVFVVRCDLRFPLETTEAEFDPKAISRFINSLKAKINADLQRKEQAWKRVLSCEVRYVWVREFGDVNGKKHYHVLLFFNKDVYHSLGYYEQAGGNLFSMINEAWCSAIKLPVFSFGALAHFPRQGRFYLDGNNPANDDQVDHLMIHASYLAKHITKRYGDGERSIGSSLV